VDGRTPINVSLSCCFGCPMEGEVPLAEVLRFARRFAALGVRGLTICDTTGMAHPAQVAAWSRRCSANLPALQLTLHFHNTRGMGLANVLAAVQGGITRFDGSLGGLGGCPYAPGASGNISSEDAIHMLDAMGLRHRHRPAPPAGRGAPDAADRRPRRAGPGGQGRAHQRPASGPRQLWRNSRRAVLNP
jgi:hydroxymethylglutaryl-CoA lyase